MLTVLNTDKFFYTSPDAGEPDCLCSRCNKPILEVDAPIIRAWPTKPGDYGFDPSAKHGTEFRYCRKCCEAMGLTFPEETKDRYDDQQHGEDQDDWETEGDSCPNCSTPYDDIDHEYQICHYCKFNNNSSK